MKEFGYHKHKHLRQLFAKIYNDLKLLTIFHKKISTDDAEQGPKYNSGRRIKIARYHQPLTLKLCFSFLCLNCLK